MSTTTVVGIMMVKDEVDIIKTTVTHLAHEVDHVLVADNGSTDGTLEILDRLRMEGVIALLEDHEVGYYQSAKMTALAALAMEDYDADWVVPCDADEIWYARMGGTIADMLATVGPQWLTVAADLYDHVSTGRDDLSELDPTKRIGWRRTYKAKLPKVACRTRNDLVIHQGNHGADYVGGTSTLKTPLCVRHFPYRSPAQFLSKVRNGAAAYAASNLPESHGSHWRGYGRILEHMGEEVLIRDIYEKWFHRPNPLEYAMIEGDVSGPLIFDPAPVRRD